MTNHEKITHMGVKEMSKIAVRRIVMPFSEVYMSILDATVHDTEEQTIAHNKKFLESEATE